MFEIFKDVLISVSCGNLYETSDQYIENLEIKHEAVNNVILLYLFC